MDRPLIVAPDAGPPEATVYFRPPELPRFHFAFKPRLGRVYAIDLDQAVGGRVNAFVIAEHCDGEARAFGFVQTWIRGYRYQRDGHAPSSTLIQEIKP